MARFVVIFVLAVCCVAFPGWSSAVAEDQGDFTKIFDRAELYYGNELYDRAIAEYDSILDKGFEGGNVYYNLGNCYLKKGALGKAIVCYERAKSLTPRDSDLLFNYKYAQSLIKQAKAPATKIWLLDNIWRASDLLNLKETIVVTSLIYYLNIIFIAMFALIKRYRVHLKYAITVSAIILLCALAWSMHKVEDLDQGAIIVAKIADAKFEPLEGAPANFPVYEGTKVYVLKTRGDWHKIKLSDSEVGWMKKEAVEIIGI